jgi:hypothetical protein
MADQGEFKFADWTTEHGITRASTKILSDQQLHTKDALLAVEKQDIGKIGLTVGQEALVRKAIRELGNHGFQEAEPVPVTSGASLGGQQEPSDDPNAGDPPALGVLSDKEEDLLKQAGKDLDALLRNTTSIPAPNLDKGMTSLSLQPPSTSRSTDAYDPRHLLTLKASTRKA